MKATCRDALDIYVQHSHLTKNIKVENIINFLHNYENRWLTIGDLQVIHAYITTTLVNIVLTETNIGAVMIVFSKLQISQNMNTINNTGTLIHELISSITRS